MLCRLSYVPKDGGTRTRDPWIQEGTPACAAGRLEFQGARQLQRHRGCEATVRTLDLLVQSQAWYRFHHLASGLDGETRTPNPRSPEAGALPLRHVQVGTDGGSRTRTDGGLSAAPLPVGLRQRVLCAVDQAGFEPATCLLARELRFQLRHRPSGGWSRERESNPRARRMRPR